MRPAPWIRDSRLLLAVCVAAPFAAGCTEGTGTPGSRPAAFAVRHLSPHANERLAPLRIAFGHQSVGDDIIAGIGEVLRESGLPEITITETAHLAAGGAGILHFRVGRNGDPAGKVDHFAAVVDAAAATPPDVALLKLCYADAAAGTDVRRVFEHYRRTTAALQARHPTTIFVHATMPLRTVQTGWKVPLKRLAGREPGGYADNARRHEYNELLRSEYRGRAPLFDLAAIEATLPDGGSLTLAHRGVPFASMVPDYSSDGGHLNPLGRRLVAERFLALLAQLAGGPPTERPGSRTPTGTP